MEKREGWWFSPVFFLNYVGLVAFICFKSFGVFAWAHFCYLVFQCF